MTQFVCIAHYRPTLKILNCLNRTTAYFYAKLVVQFCLKINSQNGVGFFVGVFCLSGTSPLSLMNILLS